MKKKKKKILVVEDEAVSLLGIQAGLEGAGHEVIKAVDGNEGLEKLKKEKPDLVLLDIVMPVMDGYEFFKEARVDPVVRNIPIILVTARSGMKSTFDALEADGFMVKPLDTRELLENVDTVTADRVLILTDDDAVLERVSTGFLKAGYRVCRAQDEREFFEKGRKERFSCLALHLACVNGVPAETLVKIDGFKNNTPFVVLYSDPSARGTEDNDTLKIDALRILWKKSGVNNFYDPRVAGNSFVESLESWGI
ncbi:MAG: response regulator [Candidatus Omnitrophica bacterium]|nr:response regulator [Candidatus Omnitrophota bacterium]MDD5487851.1 response regulator [Candidatus Omnitrophota bacterium]